MMSSRNLLITGGKRKKVARSAATRDFTFGASNSASGVTVSRRNESVSSKRWTAVAQVAMKQHESNNMSMNNKYFDPSIIAKRAHLRIQRDASMKHFFQAEI